MTFWNVDFLNKHRSSGCKHRYALIILNQPFSLPLLIQLWNATAWHCCADGGANRLYDVTRKWENALKPDLIKGDLDSIRDDVRHHYCSKGVPIVLDEDQDSTDLMKCVNALEQKETNAGLSKDEQYDIIVLGGLSGRLDQTVHTLSYLHKLRKTRKRVYAITDDNVSWVLDTGEHRIHIDHSLLGLTCGLLPVGIDETILSTKGLKWNLTNQRSSFDGLMSTSNHLVPGQDEVWIRTSKPIWWTVELRTVSLPETSAIGNDRGGG